VKRRERARAIDAGVAAVGTRAPAVRSRLHDADDLPTIARRWPSSSRDGWSSAPNRAARARAPRSHAAQHDAADRVANIANTL